MGSDSQDIVVTDASILIDLIDGEILHLLFSLPKRIRIPDVILQEVNDVDWANFAGQYEILTFSAEEMATFSNGKVQGLSLEDRMCLEHAKILNAELLTSDNKLRKTAQKAGITVHGSLYVLDCLNELGHSTYSPLLKIMTVNTRLPQAECAERLAKWKPL